MRGGEPTLEELIKACEEVLSEEAIEDMKEIGDFSEALGFAFTALIEAGENPGIFLAEKGILEVENE